MRILLLSLLVLSLSACSLLYRLPTRQGNLIDQRDLTKLEVGMTRDQVRFVLGAPVASNPFRDDRWDYLSYYKSPRGEVTKKTVSLFFDQDRVVKMEGVEAALAQPADSPTDAKTDKEAAKKQQLESKGSRPDAGESTGETPQPTPAGAP